MFGKTRHGKPYYCCQPERRLGKRAASELADHPPTVYVREEALVRGILGFFGERIFGPRRRELLEEDVRASVQDIDEERGRGIAKLRRAVERIEAQQARQVRNLEPDDDPEGVMFRRTGRHGQFRCLF